MGRRTQREFNFYRKERKGRKEVEAYSHIPIFQYSNIPILQYCKAFQRF